jgi:hypothetical protein
MISGLREARSSMPTLSRGHGTLARAGFFKLTNVWHPKI